MIVVTNNTTMETKYGREVSHQRHSLVLTPSGAAVATGETRGFGYTREMLGKQFEGSYAYTLPQVNRRCFIFGTDQDGGYSFWFSTELESKPWVKLSMLSDRNGPGGGLKPNPYWNTRDIYRNGAFGNIHGKPQPGSSTIMGSRTVLNANPGRQPNDPILSGGETTSWNLTRHEKLEVVVEIPDYSKWVPEATTSPTEPGPNPLVVRASLRSKDSSPVREKAVKFIFELVATSREPGVCGNYPPLAANAPPAEPDLQFDSRLARARNLIVLDEQGKRSENGRGTKAETLPVPDGHTQAEAEIGCYDWGAYGELIVTAEMPGGRQIVGYMERDRTNPYILIPKRQPGSHIADKWKEGWKAKVPNIFAMSDDDDSEDNPHGSKHEPDKGPGGNICEGGHKGDGLTLYEEYRGFSVHGKHVRGDPSLKKVFIRRGANLPDDVVAGVSLFEGLTGLKVYYGLSPDECGPDESKVVVNSNSSPIHTKGDKFGIRMVKVDTAGTALGSGGPGRPKTVTITRSFSTDQVEAIRSGKGKLLAFNYPRVIAHELLHTCNVDHHASWTGHWVDRGPVTWEILPDGETLRETTTDERCSGNKTVDIPLRNIEWEHVDIPQKNIQLDGAELISPDLLKRWVMNSPDHKVSFFVARQHGEHSGYRDCVMRYYVAEAYIPSRGDNYRYLCRSLGGKDFSTDLPGMSLCDQQEDTAVNEPGWSMPALGRYGSAPRGFCKSQICVNDAKHKDLANKR
jgi:hypothetical protein